MPSPVRLGEGIWCCSCGWVGAAGWCQEGMPRRSMLVTLSSRPNKVKVPSKS